MNRVCRGMTCHALLDVLNSGREFVIKGDGKSESESGDLYLRVTDQGEFS